MGDSQVFNKKAFDHVSSIDFMDLLIGFLFTKCLYIIQYNTKTNIIIVALTP